MRLSSHILPRPSVWVTPCTSGYWPVQGWLARHARQRAGVVPAEADAVLGEPVPAVILGGASPAGSWSVSYGGPLPFGHDEDDVGVVLLMPSPSWWSGSWSRPSSIDALALAMRAAANRATTFRGREVPSTRVVNVAACRSLIGSSTHRFDTRPSAGGQSFDLVGQRAGWVGIPRRRSAGPRGSCAPPDPVGVVSTPAPLVGEQQEVVHVGCSVVVDGAEVVAGQRGQQDERSYINKAALIARFALLNRETEVASLDRIRVDREGITWDMVLRAARDPSPLAEVEAAFQDFPGKRKLDLGTPEEEGKRILQRGCRMVLE